MQLTIILSIKTVEAMPVIMSTKFYYQSYVTDVRGYVGFRCSVPDLWAV